MFNFHRLTRFCGVVVSVSLGSLCVSSEPAPRPNPPAKRQVAYRGPNTPRTTKSTVIDPRTFFTRAKAPDIQRAVRMAKARGWTPKTTGLTISTGTPRSLSDGTRIDHVQNMSKNLAEGLIQIWDWDTGDANTMGATVYVELYSTGQSVMYNVQLDMSYSGDDWDQSAGDLVSYGDGTGVYQAKLRGLKGASKGPKVQRAAKRYTVCCYLDDADILVNGAYCMSEAVGSTFKTVMDIIGWASDLKELWLSVKYGWGFLTHSISLGDIMDELIQAAIDHGDELALQNLLWKHFEGGYDCRRSDIIDELADFYCGNNWNYWTTDYWDPSCDDWGNMY